MSFNALRKELAFYEKKHCADCQLRGFCEQQICNDLIGLSTNNLFQFMFIFSEMSLSYQTESIQFDLNDCWSLFSSETNIVMCECVQINWT